MKRVSEKRREWLKTYAAVRDSFSPTECARCGLKGEGWEHLGGDFQSHHPMRRDTRAQVMCFVSLCPVCHTFIEDHATQGRSEGWIINPKKVSMFEREKES